MSLHTRFFGVLSAICAAPIVAVVFLGQSLELTGLQVSLVQQGAGATLFLLAVATASYGIDLIQGE